MKILKENLNFKIEINQGKIYHFDTLLSRCRALARGDKLTGLFKLNSKL